MPVERPIGGGDVALADDDLARIGLAVVYESAAKAATASALRALASLSEPEWLKLERVQFKQILERLRIRADEVSDDELIVRLVTLEEAVRHYQPTRHVVVHAMWGYGGPSFVGYDYGRKRELTTTDIDEAVTGCAEIKRAANWLAMRVANLIEEGVLPERAAGPGVSLRTERRLVRL